MNLFIYQSEIRRAVRLQIEAPFPNLQRVSWQTDKAFDVESAAKACAVRVVKTVSDENHDIAAFRLLKAKRKAIHKQMVACLQSAVQNPLASLEAERFLLKNAFFVQHALNRRNAARHNVLHATDFNRRLCREHTCLDYANRFWIQRSSLVSRPFNWRLRIINVIKDSLPARRRQWFFLLFVVYAVERWLHASSRNLERLDEERTNAECNADGDNRKFKIRAQPVVAPDAMNPRLNAFRIQMRDAFLFLGVRRSGANPLDLFVQKRSVGGAENVAVAQDCVFQHLAELLQLESDLPALRAKQRADVVSEEEPDDCDIQQYGVNRIHFSSVLERSTAMNASCGMLTLPISFMRFLPSRCLSSNLRLRVMSPP